MSNINPIMAEFVRWFSPPLSELHRPAMTQADRRESYRDECASGMDCADSADEREALAWRGCLGERTL